MTKITRREFVRTGAVAGVVAVAPRRAFGQAPTVLTPRSVKPVVVSSANGNRYKNGGTQTCVEKAFTMITQGTDVLDALIAGVNLNELDPEEGGVGYGGTPNADGVVQLDSCCMHGPKKQAGGVAAIEGVRTPSLVAKGVMGLTDHHLLVGKGAQDFARNLGFTIEADLNTERSRARWLEWKRRTDPSHYLDPTKRQEAALRVLHEMVAEGLLDPEHYLGTINCDGINAKGEICGVTTTSGLAFKIPGRAGDSPILGAGLYVDGAVGAAGSTGRGDASEGCRHRRPQADQGQHDREAAAQREGRAQLRHQLLHSQRQGRARRRVDVHRVELRGLHGERAADAPVRGADRARADAVEAARVVGGPVVVGRGRVVVGRDFSLTLNSMSMIYSSGESAPSSRDGRGRAA